MQKLASVSLLLSLLFTTAKPGWAIKPPKFPLRTNLLKTIGRNVPMRQGEWRLLKDFLNSSQLERQLRGAGTFRPARRQLQQFDPRRSFSSLTAEQPPVKAVLSMIDIQQFVAQHDNQFPTPQDTEAFKQVLEILVFAQTKQIDGSVKDMLADLYAGPESPVTPAALPKRVEDIDGWMKNTPPEVQLAAVHAGLSKTKKPAPGTQPTTQPAVAANPQNNPQKVNPPARKRETLAVRYYSVEQALDRLKRDTGRKTRMPTPFGDINDFWAVLSLIHANDTGKLNGFERNQFFSYTMPDNKYINNPALIEKDVRVWQGLNRSLVPTLPDPEIYPTADHIFKASPAKQMEYQLAVTMWYLKQLVPVEDQPEMLKNWDPYAKQPEAKPLAVGHTDISTQPRRAAKPTQVRGSAHRQEKQPLTSRDPAEVVGSMSFPNHKFPNVEDDPKHFLEVLYVLENWKKLGQVEQEQFVNILKESSLGKWQGKLSEEWVANYIDTVCREYRIEKTMYLPLVKDYPTVHAIRQAGEGLRKLWIILLPLRALQIAFPEKLEPSLQTLNLIRSAELIESGAAPAKVSATEANKVQPDWGYVPSDPALQDVQNNMQKSGRWPINKGTTPIAELPPILDLVARAAQGSLENADWDQLQRLFASDPNNSVANIQKWLEDGSKIIIRSVCPPLLSERRVSKLLMKNG